MSRMESTVLKSLIEAADAGGYTIPEELADAYARYLTLAGYEVPTTPAATLDDLAARLAREGVDADPLQLAREYHAAESQRAYETNARALVRQAVERAADAATSIGARDADLIITERLRPALEEVYDQAREVAASLAGYGLDTHALITAPGKVRDAYGRLPHLVSRRSAIFRARRWANSLAYHQPQHDVSGLYGEFRTPLALSPGWSPPSPIPGIPAPTDPTERLLWCVGPEGTVAHPWLPTVAEQDAAWWDRFGEGVEARKQMSHSARAIAAQIA